MSPHYPGSALPLCECLPSPSALLGRDPLLRRFISILLPFHAKVAAAAAVV